MRKIILLALLLRLSLAPLAQHPDAAQIYLWSKDIFQNGLLDFYDRQIPNATRPNYPAISAYFLYLNGLIHEILLKTLWLFNLIPPFPSNLIFWFEKEAGWYFSDKLVPIFYDLGIIYLLYLLTKDLKNKFVFLPSLFFAFLPPFFYNSAVWGQTDSIYGLLVLVAFYTLFRNKLLLSSTLYLFAILTKPTSLFAFPIFASFWLRRSTPSKTIKTILLSLLVLLLVYLPFHPHDLIFWVVTFYTHSLEGQLNYLVANAFNLWALLFGFDNRPDSTPIFTMASSIIGNTIFTLVALFGAGSIFFRKKFQSREKILLISATVSLAAFLFLPRMHERYLYPALILLLPLAATNRAIRLVVITLSIIHFVNLYHFWWVPRIELLTALFTNPYLISILIVINLLSFGYLLKKSLS